MKKPIALLLVSIMVLMLSAFSFAGNGNLMMTKEYEPKVDAFILGEELFITVWIDAELGDELDDLWAELYVDDELTNEFDDFTLVSKTGSKVYKYVSEGIEPPTEDFDILVNAEFNDSDDDFEIRKSFEFDDIEEDTEDSDEEMDDDMYPAAPAVANKLLKKAEIQNRVEGVNLIALVAAEMNEDEPFGLDEEVDQEDFEDAVKDFLILQLNKIFFEEDDDYVDELEDFTTEIGASEKPVANPNADKVKPQNDDDENEDNKDKEKPNKK